MTTIRVKVKPNSRASTLEQGSDGVWLARLRFDQFMEQSMKSVAKMILSMLVAGVCAAAGLDDYKEQMLPASPKAEAGKKNLTVMFIGVATLLFDDGETAIMTDGFFSRPPNSS
jgi:hypothetical protein